MTVILKCRSCGYIGPWKECCTSMNFDVPTADETWGAAGLYYSSHMAKYLEKNLLPRVPADDGSYDAGVRSGVTDCIVAAHTMGEFFSEGWDD